MRRGRTEEHYHLVATDYTLIMFLRQVAREVNTLSPSSTLRIESTSDAVFEDSSAAESI